MQANQTHDIEKKTYWINWIAAFFVCSSIGLAAYLGWQSHHLNQSSEALKVAIETQKENLIKLKEREQIGERMKAAQILGKAKNYRKNWSVVLNDLNQTFTTNSKALKFNRVAIDNNNTIQVNASTRDILTAAGFLVRIKRSDLFENAFISKISPQSKNESGGTSYNFQATFDYTGFTKNGTKTN